MNSSNLLKKVRKFILVALVMLIIVTGYFLIDSIQTTKTLENQAANPIAGQCLQADDFCNWDRIDGADTQYEYKLIDNTTSQEIIVAEGNTKTNSVQFQPIHGHTYICQVRAVQGCKRSEEFASSSLSSCPQQKTDNPQITEPVASITSALSTTKSIKIIQFSPTPASSIDSSTPTQTIPSPTKILVIIPTTSIYPTQSPKVTTTQLPEAGVSDWLISSIVVGLGIIMIGFAL